LQHESQYAALLPSAEASLAEVFAEKPAIESENVRPNSNKDPGRPKVQ
jgi:hypothetical protein